ncbi:methyltransferase type 11 [candidate division WOR-1 bacterium RIFOXYD2_FULL_36_8]|uniref:Methyltransferase type 11 n=1 Tax=candidate division WOR-1 bacterium RIFOXYB2_FULL_36_35 TaxID=1802578 RepID=A0A1F4S2T5_UNCSA|nr:MAG: methyltransferase type 11 [candidate division WOR-1 bacterium RIFOXYA2_FULL_36_21]OGC14742.1 MAG: methyltransferase type 11 [candidate division WOR-1 bacterium RIFOXYB2_FULL_36_35]OGC15474.1 MAG: methyltransferase type 11 [candidate division WOR-1 bacterium RIFOXYA12_FULL_36_13]OGC38037.1 MAG: methyltransferase type 11 [candidate division WOR-1 bacterium RIFOXYD2_FULL_36_8]
MKARDSGMPDSEMWKKFFNPDKILATLGLNNKTYDVAEFGCGYGTFTIPAGKIIKGKIFALDIEPEMISTTKSEAIKHGLKNIEIILRDFVSFGSGLEDESVDYAMLFNILHLENPTSLLLEANRILKKDGKVGIIHWNYDSTTPRGPSMDIRPNPDQCVKWGEEAGFDNPIQFNLKPYHYGIVLSKKRGLK